MNSVSQHIEQHLLPVFGLRPSGEIQMKAVPCVLCGKLVPLRTTESLAQSAENYQLLAVQRNALQGLCCGYLITVAVTISISEKL